MQLAALSDDVLLSRLDRLAGIGWRVDARLIAYLAEVEARGLHFEKAYSSLQDFCIRRFGMSEGEAFRRMTAARLVRDFPSILERIARGDIHLSALVLLRDYLTMENHEDLLSAATKKTKGQVKALIAERFPRPDVPSTIVTIPEQTPLANLPTCPNEGASLGACATEPLRQAMEPLSATRHRVEFTASTELRQKIERAVELMRHKNPRGDLAVVVERAIDLLIAKLEKDRFGKVARPRKPTDATTAEKKEKDEEENAKKKKRTRYIDREARREVHARDGEQCAYVAADGSRCPSRAFLQLDHVEPWGRDGSNEPSNLRHLCFGHNRFHAQRTYGKDYVEKKINLRQRKSTARPASTDSCAAPSKRDDPRPPAMPDPSRELDVMFEKAASGLRGLGFRDQETRRALAIVRERLCTSSSAMPPIESVIREALGVLT
jgi:hypothetical protein